MALPGPGEMLIGFDADMRNVIVQFPDMWIQLSPEEAKNMAALLLAKAAEIERLRALPAWRPASEIPTERRPEDDELSPRYPLLVERRGGETLLGVGFYCYLSKGWNLCFPQVGKVTHWLPLPAPREQQKGQP